jgi:hypothetical protein
MKGDLFNDQAIVEDLKVGFTQGFDGVVALLVLCNLSKAAEAITEVTSNHFESWI